MCILIVSKKDVKLPSEEVLKECFYGNPDGAGFAVSLGNGKVHYEKGFMTFTEWNEAIKRADQKYDMTKHAVVLHARISTCNGVTPQLTHPFPVDESYKKMTELTGEVEAVFAHNGIFSSKFQPTKDEMCSDTMKFNKEVIYKYYKKDKYFMHNPQKRKIVSDLAQSCRIAFLNGFDEVEYAGNFIEEDGILYSNSSYKPSTYTYSKWYSTPAYGYGSNYSYGYGWDDYMDEYEEYAKFYYDSKEDFENPYIDENSDMWCKPISYKGDVEGFNKALADLTILDYGKCCILDDNSMIVTNENFEYAIDKYWLMYRVNWIDMTISVLKSSFVIDIVDTDTFAVHNK